MCFISVFNILPDCCDGMLMPAKTAARQRLSVMFRTAVLPSMRNGNRSVAQTLNLLKQLVVEIFCAEIDVLEQCVA